MSDQPQTVDVQWWTKSGVELARCAFDVVSRIRRRQEYRRQQFAIYQAMYGGLPLGTGTLPFSYAQTPSSLGTQLSLNVARSVVDSVVASVAAKSAPKPTYLTTDDWALRRRAQKRELLVEGAMKKGGYYRILPLQMRAGCIYGTGPVKVFTTPAGEVKYERIKARELLVDDDEAEHGDPPSAFHFKGYDRARLSKMFAKDDKAVEAIKLAQRYRADAQGLIGDPTADRVLVYEGWRLPTEPGADDGKHAIFIGASASGSDGGYTLLEEPYTWDRFPISVSRWNVAEDGWYGEGLIQEVSGIQLEINDILDELQEATHGIKGKWLVEEGSEVDVAAINDELVAILQYRGIKPEYVQPQAIPPDVYEHLWRLVQAAYEISGKSQLAATGRKPSGLQSGEALRAYADQGTERFLHKYQMLEETVLDTAELTERCLIELAKGKSVKLVVNAGMSLREIGFEETQLEDGSYRLEIQASSQLPNNLAGRIDTVQEMAKTGAFSPDELLEYMQGPDTKDLAHRRNASRRFTEMAFSRLLDGQKAPTAEPEMDLATCLRVAIELYAVELGRDVPPSEEVQDAMLRWIELVRRLKKMAEAQNAPPPPTAPSPDGQQQPGGPPGAPPSPGVGP